MAWVLGIPAAEVELPRQDTLPRQPRTNWRDMLGYRRSVAFTWVNSLALQFPFYGIILWGPALISLTMNLKPAEAARLMVLVSLGGFVGRIVAARLSEVLGRRHTGILFMGSAAVLLAAIALLHGTTTLGVSTFYVGLLIGWFFLDGSFAVALPYWAEHFPTRVRSTGTGVAYGFGGLGKVLGPAVLMVISGAGTAIEPAATGAALLPTFLLFAAAALVGAFSYALLGVETRGLSMAELEKTLEQQIRPPAGDAAPVKDKAPV